MSEHLPEDQDLLDDLDHIGPMSTGVGLSEQQRKISVIQIKAILRNRKTMNDLEKSTSRYSIVLIIFTLVLIMFAIAQFTFDVAISQHIWVGVGLIAFSVLGAILLFRELDPDRLLKQ